MTRTKRIALVGGLGLVALVFLYAAAVGDYGYGWYRLAYFVVGGGCGYGAYYFYAKYGLSA